MPEFGLTKPRRIHPHDKDVLYRDYASPPVRDGKAYYDEPPECDFCPVPLTTGLAFKLRIVVIGDDGKPQEIFFQAGPDCAANQGKTDPRDAPDLTRDSGSPWKIAKRPGGRLIRSSLHFDFARALDEEHRKDVAYMQLRGDKLPNKVSEHVPKAKFEAPPIALAEALKAYNTDPVTAPMGEIRRLRLMAETGDQRYSHDTLAKCYEDATWMDRCLDSKKMNNAEMHWLRKARTELVHTHSLSVIDGEYLGTLVHQMIPKGMEISLSPIVRPQVKLGLFGNDF